MIYRVYFFTFNEQATAGEAEPVGVGSCVSPMVDIF